MVATTAKLLSPVHARLSEVLERYSLSMPSERIMALGFILILLQIADGLLTTMGISILGTEAEGNPLLRFLMELIGTVPALVICKSLAIAIILALCMLSGAVSWLEHAFKVVIGVYLLAAVIPWSIILMVNLA